MSQCAEDYAQSLANPFEGPDDPCIPDYPALMTGRFKVWAKGTFATSTNPAANGFGFIAVDPLNGMANDAGSVVTNAPASTDVVIAAQPFGAQEVVSNTNSPYATANYIPATPNSLQTRVVSSGLRIRYIGTELNRGGQIVGLHHPAHQTLSGFNIATMDTFKESGRLPVIRDWTTLLYRPVDTNDLNFVSTFNPAVGQYFMGFCIQAADPSGANPQSFEYEFFSNYETQGAIVQNKKPSHVDPTGHGAVNAITNIASNLHKPHTTPSADVATAIVHAASNYLYHHTSKPSTPPKKESSSFPWKEVLSIGGNVVSTILSLI